MKGFYFREALDRLLASGRLAPFLLVPPLLALTVSLENTFPAMSWLIPVFEPSDPARGRLGFALWNAILVTSLLSGITGAAFFHGTFGSGWFRSCLALPAGKASAYWSTVFAHFLVSVCILALTSGAIIAALHVPEGFPLFMTIAGGIAVLSWTTAFSAFAGLLAPSWGAAVLQAGIAFGSFALARPQLDALFSPLGLSDLILPPLGRMAARGMPGWPDGYATLALLCHAAFFALAGALLFGSAAKRPKADR
jgi:hypothetical protein